MVKQAQPLQANKLLSFSLFAPLSIAQINRVLESCRALPYRANQIVFRQGECGNTLFIVLQGSVKIEFKDSAGILYPLGELHAGDLCGDLSLLRGVPSRATLKASPNTELLEISRETFLEMITSASPEQALDIFLAIQTQLNNISERGYREAFNRRFLAAKMEIEKQRAMTQMVAGVAHEINTPLAVMNTAVTVMARELATAPPELTAQRAAEIAESLELMRLNVEQINQLVQNFKNVSASQLSDEKGKFNVVEVIEESIGLMAVHLKRKQVRVKFQHNLTREQSQWVGYRGLLSQALINLLTNVERYAYPNGGGVVDVSMSWNESGNYVLRVRDYGMGIPAEIQPQIFDPFFTTGKETGGTGLGLSIVNNIVTHALKGALQVKSEEGKGAEFLILFPQVTPQ